MAKIEALYGDSAATVFAASARKRRFCRRATHVLAIAAKVVAKVSEGIHQPMNVLLQSRQVARDPSVMISLCMHFLQREQRRSELSETSCLQAAISSGLFAVRKAPGCTAA